MQKDRPAQFFRLGIDVPEPSIVQVYVVDMGGEIHSSHPGQLGGALEFLERKLGRLHGEHRQTHEAVWMPGVRRCRGIVVGLRERESESGRRPIHHRRRERHGMDIHPLPVHAVEAKPKIDELFGEGVDDAVGSDGIAARRALELCAFGRAVAFEQPEPVDRIPMGVNIDDPPSVFRRRCVIVSIGGALGHRLDLRLR